MKINNQYKQFIKFTNRSKDRPKLSLIILITFIILIQLNKAPQLSCQNEPDSTDEARLLPCNNKLRHRHNQRQQRQFDHRAAPLPLTQAPEEFNLNSGSTNQTGSGAQLPVANTTPTLPSDSIGSPPVGAQAAATTISAIAKEAPSEAVPSEGPLEAGSGLPAPTDQQPDRPAPVSSAPSSISIITPIFGLAQPPPQAPPLTSTEAQLAVSQVQQQQQQQQQSAMVRPIYVLGAPIGDSELAGDLAPAGETATRPQGRPGRAERREPDPVGVAANVSDTRIAGPALVYSDGQLTSAPAELPPVPTNHTARLFQVGGAAVLPGSVRKPSLPPPVNQANAASGLRSPLSSSGPLLATAQAPQALQAPVNGPNFYQTAPPYAGGAALFGPAVGAGLAKQSAFVGPAATAAATNQQQVAQIQLQQQQQQQQQQQIQASSQQAISANLQPNPSQPGRRPLNITRVEHISAECSNDLIRAVIVFNGTFKGIIYSSGYVNDPTCLYVNGTGSTRYEFSIRLNQCGTLGRQELHQPTIPGEARRRDQVMWNTLSIQYNSIIEQEWDEHFRVSCEYGSDFWKTVSFSPFNVETNTGSPIVFTINPPQCQMDVLLGHGMGPKIAVDGPVTVGDPLTLLIHMKSEKAGYDILVKNCVAHNGGKQRMQLIDSNGCVVNERFISPFRGTYNDNDLRHVTLYAYLKAFRFTGSPVLYLECEIHMCQSACPPQMCYWRRLSKRSVDQSDYEYTTPNTSIEHNSTLAELPIISDSLSLFKALQVRQDNEPNKQRQRKQLTEIHAEDEEAALVCYRPAEVFVFMATSVSLLFLVVIISVVFCWRLKKLSNSQFKHNRLTQSPVCSSPSLLSLGEAIFHTGLSFDRKPGAHCQPAFAFRPTEGVACRQPHPSNSRRRPRERAHIKL